MPEEFNEEQAKKSMNGICVKKDCERPHEKGYFLCEKCRLKWDKIWKESGNDRWIEFINTPVKKAFIFR